MTIMSTSVQTCLTFPNNKAEEVVTFYVSLFKDQGKIVSKMGGGGGAPVVGLTFELAGTTLLALNGPDMGFAGGTSLMVQVDTQDDVDHLWNNLTKDGGKEGNCGWLTDKYGVTWQIIPRALGQMLSDQDRAKAGRALEAMLKMKKIHEPTMRKAFNGE